MNIQDIVRHAWVSRRTNEYVRWYPKRLVPSTTESSRRPGRCDGLYIHVPFCDDICSFCPYNKRKSDPDLVQRYVSALCREVELCSEWCGASHGLGFINFGGGTPSVLRPDQIGRVLATVDRCFGVRADAEVSLEAHPRDAVRPGYLRDVRTAGINRVSIGIQSFDAGILSALRTHHNAVTALNAVHSAHEAVSNVAIDLLYGFEGQSVAAWEQDLQKALSLGVKHISCYPLVPIGDAPAGLDPAREIEMAMAAMSRCRSAGLEHYASCASGGFDCAAPDRIGIYELQHWMAPQTPFAGLGPGAFGVLGDRVTTNVLKLEDYLGRVASGVHPVSSETEIAHNEQMHKYFVIGVKTLRVPLGPFEELFGCKASTVFAAEFRLLSELGLAQCDGSELALTECGRLYVDQVSALFFSEDERDVPHPEEPELRALERTAPTLTVRGQVPQKR